MFPVHPMNYLVQLVREMFLIITFMCLELSSVVMMSPSVVVGVRVISKELAIFLSIKLFHL